MNSRHQFTFPLLYSSSSWKAFHNRLETTYGIHVFLPSPSTNETVSVAYIPGVKNLEILIPGMLYNSFQVTSDIIKFSDGSVISMFKTNICSRTWTLLIALPYSFQMIRSIGEHLNMASDAEGEKSIWCKLTPMKLIVLCAKCCVCCVLYTPLCNAYPRFWPKHSGKKNVSF